MSIAKQFAFAIALLFHLEGQAQATQPNPFDLSLEQLGELSVTTVSRRAEALNQTAASVYVITAEDIRRSGVTSIPEALRLAPGVEVARNGSSEWTVSIRGFSSDLSNKLLVLIDGRSVYSPLFAGVFWDVQDVLLHDVDRIEVVSGPGGTLWGANAVNGVVNIITRTAGESQGAFAELGGGSEEASAGLRYGWRVGETLTASAFVKGTERDAAELGNGAGAVDEWEMARTGLGLEWRPTARDAIDVRAVAYAGEQAALIRGDFTVGTLPGPSTPGTVRFGGRSVTASWHRSYSADSSLAVQAYYDYTDRQIPNSFDEARDTWNVAFQHDLASIGRHDLQWGAELRSTKDRIGNTVFATFTPDSRSDETISAFIQDRIRLHEDTLFLTVGSKLEHNNYTGRETQPNIRLTWLPNRAHSVWSAVSRAVRVPARLNTDLELLAPIGPIAGAPFYVNVMGSPAFESERVLAYEAGYRWQASTKLSADFALFDNYYDQLQTQEGGVFTPVPGPPAYFVFPATLANEMEGETYGGTAAITWQPLLRWRLQLHYAHLQMDLVRKPASNDGNSMNVVGNSPQRQASVRSYLDLPANIRLYTGVRYVGDLPNQRVPSYAAVDASLEWGASRPGLRASLTIQNLNDDRHLEFGGDTYIERSAFARVSWVF